MLTLLNMKSAGQSTTFDGGAQMPSNAQQQGQFQDRQPQQPFVYMPEVPAIISIGNTEAPTSSTHSEGPKTSGSAHNLGPRADPLYNPTNTTNVYINNLPTAFTEHHLYQLCSGFGPISSVRMMLRETGTCYGFVLFEGIEAAESCIMWLRQFSDVHPSFARVNYSILFVFFII
ncbi:hypothetical protein DL93DRAFT_136619 [Clavulina sp. PMI_390]|nr:hypothetical protein DL93DRAFT_136619 [Clavulina sp. PMI_390]